MCYKVPSQATFIHEVLATGRPDPNNSYITLSNYTVMAGTSPGYIINLYDEYVNPITLEKLAPQQSVSIKVDFPDNSSAEYQVNDVSASLVKLRY
jgi:hypothetical protein